MILLTLIICIPIIWSVDVDQLIDDYKKSNYDGYTKKRPTASSKNVPLEITDVATCTVVATNMYDLKVITKGEVQFGVFGNVVPITTLNFLMLMKGIEIKGNHYSYVNSTCTKIIRDFSVTFGNLMDKGTYTFSIFGDSFIDENYYISHVAGGYLSMASQANDENHSEFFVLLEPARWIDKRYVSFGKVVKGMNFIKKLGELPLKGDMEQGLPLPKVEFESCQVKKLSKTIILNEKQKYSDKDIF
ncbi:hypothetical protein SNEBB_003031 [Seison nebaliae]|nr:hypothetical protein SNEBB_003031 [Seison nebaliae]